MITITAITIIIIVIVITTITASALWTQIRNCSLNIFHQFRTMTAKRNPFCLRYIKLMIITATVTITVVAVITIYIRY